MGTIFFNLIKQTTMRMNKNLFPGCLLALLVLGLGA
jgi:hypothetical protein